ncbi:MAG: Rne/Rng family ribonuclease [Desulfomonile sp.]|nr:Rne/Rng family ribonuclease [Desulfomonile sp.]
MIRKMLINAAHPEECRVAVVCDGILEELDVQIRTHEPTLSNIYKGVITRVEPSLQAAFVDYGAARNGFLSLSDVHPSYFPDSFKDGKRRPRLEEVFKKGDHVIVQVAKEERDNKGASLTTNISLAGRYLVLMPGTDLHGVSRKIEDEKERQKLKEIVKQLKLPEHMGFIIRTAGVGRTKTELSRDLEYLLKLWHSIEENVVEKDAPALLYREHDLVIRSIRDHFQSDISEILVDDKAVYNKAREFFRQLMPKYENIVKLYQEKRPLFNKYQLEEQVEQVYRKRIRLKSGGYIVIEPTEALVTVDVNSGSATRERGIEETAYRVNMEAAPEIARQLRLRDLGGIIVIDFIDMVGKKHKQDVEKALKDVLKKDRAKTKVLRISSLGLLELSRQRLKSVLGTGEYLDCPHCEGRGKVRSVETAALSIFRRIKSLAIKSDVAQVCATVPGHVAEYLLNSMRSLIVQVERDYDTRITIVGRDPLPEHEVTIEAVKRETVAPAGEPELVAAQLGPPEAAQVEEQPAVEAEKKRERKPQRRRRRGKKKPIAEVTGEQFVAEEEEVEEVAFSAEGPLEEEIVGPHGESLEAEAPPQGESTEPEKMTATEDPPLAVVAEEPRPPSEQPAEPAEEEPPHKPPKQRSSLRRLIPFF